MKKNILILLIFIINSNFIFSNDSNKMLDSAKKLIDCGKYDLARDISNDLLARLLRDNNDTIDHRYILTLGHIGVSYYFESNIDSAIVYFKKAISLYNQQDNQITPDLARYYSYLGLSYLAKTQYEKAEENLLKSKSIINLVAPQADVMTAEINSNLAKLYRITGKYKLSEEFYLKSIEIFDNLKITNNDELAGTYNGLAILYRSMAKFKKAELFYLKALEIYESMYIGDNKDLAIIFNNLGVFYYQIGDYSSAKIYLEKSFEINNRLYKEDNNNFAASIHNMAHFYEKIEDYEKAKYFFVRAIDMRRRLFRGDHPDLSKSLIGLADFYKNRLQLDSSLAYYEEVIEMRRRLFKSDHPDVANALNSLATVYNKMYQHEKSLPIYLEALDIRRKLLSNYDPMLAQNINNVAFNYLLLDSIEKSYPLFIELVDNLNNIKNNYFPALTIKQKEGFFNTFKTYYDNIYIFAIENHSKFPYILEKLFEIEVQNKGMLLHAQASLKQKILKSKDSSLINNYNDWLNTKELIAKNILLNENQLKSKNIKMDSLRNASQVLEKQLNLESSEFYDEISLNNLKLEDFKSKINNNEAIITIKRLNYNEIHKFKHEEQYVFLIIKKNESFPILINKNNTFDLENKFLMEYKGELVDNGNNKQSYKNYWIFLEPYLKGIKKIYLSPDGVYNKININVLQNPKTKKYIEDDFEIVQMTSLKDIFKTKIEQNNEFILFGDPKFDNANSLAANYKTKIDIDSIDRSAINLTELPSSKIEVSEITKILRQRNLSYKTFIGLDATEENLKNVLNPKVLHLSTHGYFLRDIGKDSAQQNLKIKNDFNPLLRSMLFLTSTNIVNKAKDSTNIEDGILNGLEAQNLFLNNTELVVLAACETGLGEIKNGEGVYGLQRAFIQAGAQSLIMSLWKVNDKSTKDLMVYFYKEWLSGKSKSLSFKIAKQKIKKKYKYPYYWGAFIMIGE